MKGWLAAFLKRFRSSKWARTQARSLYRERDIHPLPKTQSFWVYYSGELPDTALKNVLAVLVDDRGNVFPLWKSNWSTYYPTREHGAHWILEHAQSDTNSNYTLRLQSADSNHLADIKIGRLKPLPRSVPGRNKQSAHPAPSARDISPKILR
jgi:hypothetical protein